MDLSAIVGALLNNESVKTAALNAAQSGNTAVSNEQKKKALAAASALGLKDTSALNALLSDPEKLRALLFAVGKGGK